MPKAETVPGLTLPIYVRVGEKSTPVSENTERYAGLEELVSPERFGTYLGWAGGDRNQAIAFYTLNAQLSESLYTPLQMLEVALRNRIHQVLSAKAGETWFDMPEHQLNSRQAEMLDKARQDLADAKKQVTAGAMVAALTFGFWTAMLGREYENLWQTNLNKIARREDGKGLQRKNFAAPLASIRTLRNRIAHHEPILHWNLRKHYGSILQMTGWLSPVAAEWCRTYSRFDALYPEGGVVLIKPKVAQ